MASYNDRADKQNNEIDEDLTLLTDTLEGKDITNDPNFKEKHANSIKRAEERIRDNGPQGMSLLLKLDLIFGGLLLFLFYFFITRPPKMWTLNDFVDMLDPRNVFKPRLT